MRVITLAAGMCLWAASGLGLADIRLRGKMMDAAAGERAIHEIASAAFSYFDRLAKGGAYGRR